MIMLCTKCKSDATTVIATEQKPLFRRRRYKCLICGERFNTREIVMASKSSNADRIRAMSDAELAVFMADKYMMESCMRLADEGYEPTEVQKKAIKHTLYCTWMEWLKQPAKEDE